MQVSFHFVRPAEDDTQSLLTNVFIDYESLFWSFRKLNEIPELNSIIKDMKEIGKIRQIKVFGDFTKPEIDGERNRIRTITNNIIDCGNELSVNKKDFTDFIMLDHIYQEVIQNHSIEQFIFLTGDGHFSSVATFLKTFMDKIVGVYGVKNTLSRQLIECSSWAKIIDIIDDDEEVYIDNLLKCFKRAEERGALATFRKTVELTSNYYGGNPERYEMVLSDMIDKGIVESELCTSIYDREFKRLVVNWEIAPAFLITE